MHRVQRLQTQCKPETASHDGFESIGEIMRRMRWLHETRITADFDPELSLTLDHLLSDEEGQQ
jgi:hypothetical protein